MRRAATLTVSNTLVLFPGPILPRIHSHPSASAKWEYSGLPISINFRWSTDASWPFRHMELPHTPRPRTLVALCIPAKGEGEVRLPPHCCTWSSDASWPFRYLSGTKLRFPIISHLDQTIDKLNQNELWQLFRNPKRMCTNRTFTLVEPKHSIKTSMAMLEIVSYIILRIRHSESRKRNTARIFFKNLCINHWSND
jgi:hypothetical protein